MDRRPEPPVTPGDGNEQSASGTRNSWADGGRSRWLVLIAGAVGLCMVLAGVAVAAFSSPGGHHVGPVAGPVGSPAVTTAPAPQPTGPAASSRATPRSGAANDGLAKSILRWPPGRTRQILHWNAGSGGRTLAAVVSQMGTAMQTAGLKLYANMKQACEQLGSDISTARTGPPIPDGAMQRLYASALVGLDNAAADCHAAISVHVDDEDVNVHVNQALLTRSREEFATESKKLYRAADEIETLHR